MRSEPKWQNVNGNLVNTNAQNFAGGLQGGMNASANGQVTAWQPDGKGGIVVGAPAGALDTARAYGQIGADMKPIKVFNPATQREEYSSEGSVVRGATPESQMRVQAQGAMGADPQAIKREMAKTEQDFQKVTDPSSKQQLQAYYQDLQTQLGRIPQGGAAVAGPSAAETAINDALKTRLTNTAAADVVRDTGNLKQVKSANEMLSDIGRAKELLKQGPTASGAGELVDKTASFFGGSTKGSEIAAQLDVVAGSLTKNVPRMEGPQSDGDREEYKTQAGRVANRALPTAQRLAAANEVEKLQNKYAGINGGNVAAPNTQSTARTMSLSDIAETAKKSGRTTAEVTAAARAKGYTIGGM